MSKQDAEYQAARMLLNDIKALEDVGILGSENMPESWGNSWPVLQPEKLPDWAQEQYNTYGEIRYYWY